MSKTSNVLPGDTGTVRYLNKIARFRFLEPAEEYALGKRVREYADEEAAHRLITSHLRLVASMAMKFRGYGLPLNDLVCEGNIGLMRAVKKFEPDKGFRLATYAIWWIRASIQEYILRSWSLVKMGTTASQKALFFNLRKVKSQISALEEGDLRPEHVKTIAQQLGVTEQDVVEMNQRMAGDVVSMQTPTGEFGGLEWEDMFTDGQPDPEHLLLEQEEHNNRHGALRDALGVLNARERRIFEARRLSEEPKTLEALHGELGISRERVRQIEVCAFKKVQRAVKKSVAKIEQVGQKELAPV